MGGEEALYLYGGGWTLNDPTYVGISPLSRVPRFWFECVFSVLYQYYHGVDGGFACHGAVPRIIVSRRNAGFIIVDAYFVARSYPIHRGSWVFHSIKRPLLHLVPESMSYAKRWWYDTQNSELPKGTPHPKKKMKNNKHTALLFRPRTVKIAASREVELSGPPPRRHPSTRPP